MAVKPTKVGRSLYLDNVHVWVSEARGTKYTVASGDRPTTATSEELQAVVPGWEPNGPRGAWDLKGSLVITPIRCRGRLRGPQDDSHRV